MAKPQGITGSKGVSNSGVARERATPTLAKLIPAGTSYIEVCDPVLYKFHYPVHVNEHPLVALVDTGATHSFIRRSLARKLKLEFHKRPAMAIGFGNESTEDADKEVRVCLQIGDKRRKVDFCSPRYGRGSSNSWVRKQC